MMKPEQLRREILADNSWETNFPVIDIVSPLQVIPPGAVS
jgi:hypothetical protein